MPHYTKGLSKFALQLWALWLYEKKDISGKQFQPQVVQWQNDNSIMNATRKACNSKAEYECKIIIKWRGIVSGVYFHIVVIIAINTGATAFGSRAHSQTKSQALTVSLLEFLVFHCSLKSWVTVGIFIRGEYISECDIIPRRSQM